MNYKRQYFQKVAGFRSQRNQDLVLELPSVLDVILD